MEQPTGRSLRRLGKEAPSTRKATRSPTTKDLAWAAGFLEGEGSFTHTGGASSPGSQRVDASQVNMEPLLRLQEIFGGKVFTREQNKRGYGWKTGRPLSIWAVYGPRARGVMMTLYPMLSERRRGQITKSLNRVPQRKAG